MPKKYVTKLVREWNNQWRMYIYQPEGFTEYALVYSDDGRIVEWIRVDRHSGKWDVVDSFAI